MYREVETQNCYRPSSAQAEPTSNGNEKVEVSARPVEHAVARPRAVPPAEDGR